MTNQIARLKIRKRIRSRISGTAQRPRLAVYRSSRTLEVQAIDDVKGKTICGAKFPKAEIEKGAKEFAQKLAEHKIKKVIFDRGGFAYRGVIKKFAEILHHEGLEF